MFSRFIDVSFHASGRTCAYDAVPSTSLDVNDVEEAIAQRCADDDHAVGSRPIIKVNSSGIGENGGCLGERNAVLLEIGSSLLAVPLEVALDDGRHSMFQYGLNPILGQGAP